MEVTPFDALPIGLLLRRFGLPILGIVLIGFYLQGIFTSLPVFQMKEYRTLEIRPVEFEGGVLQKSTAFSAQYLRWIFSSPPACQAPESDFQADQCRDYSNRLLVISFLFFFPFLLSALVFYLSVLYIRAGYRKAQRLLRSLSQLKKEQAFFGLVTDPVELKKDIFAWYFCLRVVTVELENREQRQLYVPEVGPDPRPGEKYVGLGWGRYFGARRHLGVLYAPHMVIVAGSR